MTAIETATTTTTTRYFTRCTGCLEIAAVDVPTENRMLMIHGVISMKCEICGSAVENLGRVQREGLVHDHERCACDDRCTGARGPNCSCSCGGKNHGAGINCVVTWTTEAGKVPTVAPRNAKVAAAALVRFTEFTAARAAVRADLETILDRKAKGFIHRPEFDRMRLLQDVLRTVRTAKTHGGRMKKLAAVQGTQEGGAL